jgi:hypothetical protein
MTCVELYEYHYVLGRDTVKFGTSVPMFQRNLGRRYSTETLVPIYQTTLQHHHIKP